MANKPNSNTTIYEMQIMGMRAHPEIGTYKNNLLKRDELIAKFEKSENTHQREILMKEIKKIEKIIDRYTIRYLQAERELPPEMKGYKAYTNIDEQPDHELSTAHNIIVKQREKLRTLKLSTSLARGELSDRDIEQIAENTRFKNGKLNYTALGKSLRITRQTAKKMIIDRKLTYLNTPPESK